MKVQYYHGHSSWNWDLMKKAVNIRIPKIVVASYLVKMIRDLSGQNAIAIVPNGVDIDEYYPSFPDEDRDGIGTVYNSEFAKDPDTIRKVLSKINKIHPSIPQYVFGQDKKPKYLGHLNYFRLPSVSLSRDLYSKSRVWFVASRSEGFSMPILEAMACGCVVVSTNCGGPSDIISNGKNGFLVDVGNVDEIVDRVDILLGNSDLWEKMRSNSLETAKKFSWDNTCEMFEDALFELKRLDVIRN